MRALFLYIQRIFSLPFIVLSPFLLPNVTIENLPGQIGIKLLIEMSPALF
jgi:hypothetical protein